MKLEHPSGRLRLVLLGLVAAAAGLVVWSASPGDPASDSDIDRRTESEQGSDDPAVLASAAAQARERRPQPFAAAAVPADPAETLAKETEPVPSTVRFTAQTVDAAGIAVPGISASVDVFRHEDNPNGVSVLAPSSGALSVLGRPTRRPDPREIVYRTEGPTLVGDRDGKLVLELSTADAGPGRLSATFDFHVVQDGPFAAPGSVFVHAGETRRVTVERGGSIEVHLAPLPGGCVPHVHPDLEREPTEGRRPAHHADVELHLYREFEVARSRGRSVSADTMRWDRLLPGTYEIRARAPASFGGRALATLPRLVVDEGGACDDPRLAAWNPFAGHDVMFVTIEGPDGGPPPTLTVGYAAPGHRTDWWSSGQRARYDGRALPIVGPVGVDAAVTLQAPNSRQASIDIEPGVRHVVLEAAIALELTVVVPPEMAANPTPLRLQLVRIGENGVAGFSTTTEALVGQHVLVRRALPVPGRYQVRAPLTVFYKSRDGGMVDDVKRQRFETITIDVEDAPTVRREIELVPVH